MIKLKYLRRVNELYSYLQKNDELPEVIKLLIQKKITFNIKDINVDLTNYYPWDNASQRKTRLRILQQYIAQYY